MPAEGPIPDDLARQLKHGYYAAVSYMDAQIGKVLDELDRLGLRKNTIIVLWGDHGWKLGEHGAWCKHSNVENDTNAPLLLSVPGMKNAGSADRRAGRVRGHLSHALRSWRACRCPAIWKAPASSRCSTIRTGRGSPPPSASIRAASGLMGYSMRTDRYRFTVWVGRNDHSKVDAIELYDHQTDPQENTNIAKAPANAELVGRLMELWRRGWQGARQGI